MPKVMQLPIWPYQVGGYAFGERIYRRGLPATHLGEDVLAAAGTPVRAILEGEVVLAKMLPGSQQKKTWGGVIVLKHQDSLYSVYGHLRELRIEAGEQVVTGQQVGEVAAALTPENGWWQKSHLHFAIYTGFWQGEVLPGWWRLEQFWRTKLKWWRAPKDFIEEYNGGK